MKQNAWLLVGWCGLISLTGLAEHAASSVSAEDAVTRLKKGHQRFVAGKTVSPHRSLERVRATAGGQSPFAAVLTCADSRVSPEVVFDQGIGDVFVVRTAGPVVDSYETGSLEYAARELGVPVIVVMGHTRCGAAKAAFENAAVPGDIRAITRRLASAVDHARETKGRDATVRDVVEENVRLVRKDLLESDVLEELVKSGRLKILGAVYEVESGKVVWLDQ